MKHKFSKILVFLAVGLFLNMIFVNYVFANPINLGGGLSAITIPVGSTAPLTGTLTLQGDDVLLDGPKYGCINSDYDFPMRMPAPGVGWKILQGSNIIDAGSPSSVTVLVVGQGVCHRQPGFVPQQTQIDFSLDVSGLAIGSYNISINGTEVWPGDSEDFDTGPIFHFRIVPAMSGTFTPIDINTGNSTSSCTISPGENRCAVKLSWNIDNPEDTSDYAYQAVTSPTTNTGTSGNTFISNNSNTTVNSNKVSGSRPVTIITYPSRTFFLFNNGKSLFNDPNGLTITAQCAGSTPTAPVALDPATGKCPYPDLTVTSIVDVSSSDGVNYTLSAPVENIGRASTVISFPNLFQVKNEAMFNQSDDTVALNIPADVQMSALGGGMTMPSKAVVSYKLLFANPSWGVSQEFKFRLCADKRSQADQFGDITEANDKPGTGSVPLPIPPGTGELNNCGRWTDPITLNYTDWLPWGCGDWSIPNPNDCISTRECTCNDPGNPFCGGQNNKTESRQTSACSANSPTVNLTANPPSIPSGGSSVLRWSGTNLKVDSCSASWTTQKGVIGSLSVSPLANTTYNITCKSSADDTNVSDFATVQVQPVVPIGACAPTHNNCLPSSVIGVSATGPNPISTWYWTCEGAPTPCTEKKKAPGFKEN